MRFCHNCHRITTGKPTFCGNCGSTFNARLCPRLHANPRAANVCSQCGSRDLSTPQPKVSLAVRSAVVLLGIGPGLLILVLLCIWVVFYIRQLARDPNNLLPLMLVGAGLGFLFYIWARIRESSRRRRKDR